MAISPKPKPLSPEINEAAKVVTAMSQNMIGVVERCRES
jgi:hypothetical protein